MKHHLLLFALLFSSISAISQQYISGLWEGTLTANGKEYRFEMLLEATNGQIKGNTYVFKGDREIVQASVHGKLHMDRSINLYDLEVSYEGPAELEIFLRNYQFVYQRSIWETKMEGWWQEQTPYGLNEKSKQGRIFLKKAQPKSKV